MDICFSQYRPNSFVCADEAVVVLGKKREAYLLEMQRLREAGSAAEGQGQKVSIAVRDIRLPLKSEFMSKIGSSYGN